MPTIYSYDDIRAVLPNRNPMLLLDRVKIEDDGKAIGLKVVSRNEVFFQGHFPGQPIMPGVLQVEAMFQLCRFVIAKELDPTGTQEIYLRRLKRVRFRKPVLPGDRLVIEAVRTGGEGNMVEFKASTTNAIGVTCEANITVSVRPKERPTTFENTFDEHDFYADKVALNTEQVMEIIPHRYPFMFSDFVSLNEEGRICGVKNFTGNESFMTGYGDSYAVLPASIQCEIIAQVGAINMLGKAHNKGKIALYASINEFEDHHPVFPGDRLVCDVQIPPGELKFGRGIGSISVYGKIVSSINLSFAIV